jgi:hypothetical protein
VNTERATAVDEPEDRSIRRRRKVLQAQHYRHQGRSILEIARLLGQAPATIKAYLYDPTGERARATKARYRGTCECCGTATSGADGKGRASRRCQRCKPQSLPIWTRDQVRAAHRRWYERYGFVASSYDWSATHARRRGGAALERYQSGHWPSGSVIRRLYGSAADARADAFPSSKSRTAAVVGMDVSPHCRERPASGAEPSRDGRSDPGTGGGAAVSRAWMVNRHDPDPIAGG